MHQPIFGHVNWFQRDPADGHFLWPGYRNNLRPLLWLLQLTNGEVTGTQTPVGIIPTKDELNLDGVDITPKTSRPSSPLTPTGGGRRLRTARSTSPNSPGCPNRSGKPTDASPQRSRPT